VGFNLRGRGKKKKGVVEDLNSGDGGGGKGKRGGGGDSERSFRWSIVVSGWKRGGCAGKVKSRKRWGMVLFEKTGGTT